jgi:hypothetical protein
LYYATNIVRVKESKSMSWTGHVACMGDEKCTKEFYSENLKGRDHLKDQGVNGKVIF